MWVQIPPPRQKTNKMKIEVKDITNIVRNNEVNILFYRANVIYYGVQYQGIDYHFPVRLEDIGDATLMNKDKAILLMRYIRKAIESGEFVKA